MPDDWTWFLAGEGGRDRLLREEIIGLQDQASSARSQAARLSSQLAKVQGSLENRLTALAAAFDAYVELGDVREQLAGYPDTTAVRRDASSAINALARGGTPRPLSHDDLDYWLTYATNAVIALAAGAPDPEAEAQAVALDRDAELFIVATSGALGHGALVGARVSPLLTCDGVLSTAQRALWRATVAGEFGDVLPAVHEVWRLQLDQTAESARSWAGATTGATGELDVLHWLDGLVGSVDGQSVTPVEAADLVLGKPVGNDPQAAMRDSARSGLREVAIRLVQRGQGDEVALLERSRTLRARIENPGRNGSTRDDQPDQESPGSTVTAEVRAAFLTAPPGSPLAAELLTWLTPGLAALLPTLVASAQSRGPQPVGARTPAGVIEVSTTGPEPGRLEQADQSLVARHTVPIRQIAGPGAVAGVAVALLVIGAATDTTALAVLAVVVLVIPLLMTVSAFRVRQSAKDTLASEREAVRAAVADAQASAVTREEHRQETVAEVQRLADSLAQRLGVRGATPAG